VTGKRSIADYQGYGDYDENAPPFHPGWREAEHEEGVAYICPWEDPYAGFPEHSRRCARSLDDAGVHVQLRSVDPSIQWHMFFEVGGADKLDLRGEYNDLLSKTFKKLMAEVYQIVPNDELLQKLTTSRWLDAEQVEATNRFRIISCVFERDRVTDYTVEALNRVGMVWVANRKDEAMLKGQGVERVAVVPIPHFPDDPLLKMQGRERRPGPVRFYHIGKWEPRKAHHEMLGAFLMAFKPGEAKLYFKTSTKAPKYSEYEKLDDYLAQGPTLDSGPRDAKSDRLIIPYPSSPDKSVHQWMGDTRVLKNGWTIELANQDIHLIRQRVPPEQIRLLHSMGDVYLSLSRGEGFDMPAYDAKLAGNRLVFTPSGGPQDYATVGSDLMVAAEGDVPCHPFYRWSGARYLDWRYAHAIEALRHARQRVLSGKYTGVDPVPSAFTAAEVGQKMRELIGEVIERGLKLSET
jgi:hypothetical protein